MIAVVSLDRCPDFAIPTYQVRTSPTPGVTLVKIPNTQSAGYRNPSH